MKALAPAAGERIQALDALLQRKTMPTEEDNRPATKNDLNQLRTELHGDTDELRTELRGDITKLRGDMDRLRDELVEKMRDMQTEVLRAFHDWARPIEIRLRSLPHIEERLGMLEERVTAIEQRDKLN
jgi:uncharacterized coiled-coil protein SlyX